ncbi:hypothetical protein BX600DRAFT_465174, partial [Xylariales sp. PMI_506]
MCRSLSLSLSLSVVILTNLLLQQDHLGSSRRDALGVKPCNRTTDCSVWGERGGGCECRSRWWASRQISLSLVGFQRIPMPEREGPSGL